MATIDNKVVTVESLKAVHNYNKEIYMTGYEPTGSGSLSLNRKDESLIGLNSVAVGDNTAATGDYSHAVGFDTTASGEISYAEGNGAIASGAVSHAEGDVTVASGLTSHAEGQGAVSSGKYSHAEGQYTIASGSCQHVQGKYNIEDPNDLYAHIIGNGTSTTERSNAHTLDWDGNAWYAGDFSADGNMILSSNQYGDELPAAGNAGRIFFKRLVE